MAVFGKIGFHVQWTLTPNGELFFRLWDKKRQYVAPLSLGKIQTNLWYQLAATYNSETKKLDLYVNGKNIHSVELQNGNIYVGSAVYHRLRQSENHFDEWPAIFFRQAQ